MFWTTREHWLWGLVLPGRFYLLSMSLGILVAFTPWIWRWPLSIFLIILGVLGLPGIIFRWRSFSLSFQLGGRALIEQNGIVMIAERRINLGMMGSVTFQQTWMGRILDYGFLSVGVLGGPYEWENLGHFRTLQRILESQGEWMPQTRIAFSVRIVGWFRQAIRLMSRFLMNLRQIFNSLKLEFQIIVENLRAPSYRRFLEFAEKILFPQETHRFENSIPMQSLRGSTFTENEIKIYQGILRMRRLIVLDFQGRPRRHRRIRTPGDIRGHVPVSWFRRAIRTA